MKQVPSSIPTIEVSNHTDSSSVRRPYCKARPRNTFTVLDMCSEFFMEKVMLTLPKQILIVTTD